MSHPMYPRSEFPVDTFRPLFTKGGSPSLPAIKERLSAWGCPNASAELVAAAIRTGHDWDLAFKLAMLAHYAEETMMEPIERTCAAIQDSAERRNAKAFPHGKCAEDRAARRENRPSRWNTRNFHEAAFRGECSCAVDRDPALGVDPVCFVHNPRK